MRQTFSRVAGHLTMLPSRCKIRPNMTAGRERYARIAASAGIEAETLSWTSVLSNICSRLPGDFRMQRRLAKDDSARSHGRMAARRGSLGAPKSPYRLAILSEFTTDRLTNQRRTGHLDRLQEHAHGYVDPAALRAAWPEFQQR